MNKEEYLTPLEDFMIFDLGELVLEYLPVKEILIKTWNVSYLTFTCPLGIAVSPLGELFITIRDIGKVISPDPNGKFPSGRIWNVDEPNGITVSPEGEIYITGNNQLLIFDREGNLLRTISKEVKLDHPRDIAFCSPLSTRGRFTPSSQKRLYIIDQHGQRIQALSMPHLKPKVLKPHLKPLRQEDDKPSGIFYREMAVSSKGEIFVVDSRGWRILVLSPEGDLIWQWNLSYGDVKYDEYGHRLTLSEEDNRLEIYVSYPNQRVHVYNRQGELLRAWDSITNQGKGRFIPPAMAIHGNNVYLADAHLGQIRIYERHYA
jgi:DNA-binding beta-propeller fold protein YncE